MTTRSEFFRIKEQTLVHVFKTNKEIAVQACVWRVCQNPHTDPISITVPAGVELRINSYSQGDDSYSMSFLNPRKKNQYIAETKLTERQYRWFFVKFEDMDFVRSDVRG